MRTHPELVICEHCDHVYQRVKLPRGGVARCAVCGAVLYRACLLDVDRRLAFAVTAAVFFIIGNVSPVMQISMQGLHNEVTLWQAMLALGHGQTAPIVIPAVAAAILVPGLQIGILLWILVFARLGGQAPGLPLFLRLLRLLRPWGMVEVCLFAALVAIVKLSGYLSVAPGPGIWAIAGLTLLIPLLTAADVHWLWQLLDEDQQ